MSDLRLQILLGTIDKATAPFKRILAGSQKTAQGLKRLQQQAGEIGKFRELSAASRQMGAELAAARQRVSTLAQGLRNTQAPTRAMRSEFNRAVQAARALGNAHDAQRERLHRLRQSLAAAGIQTGQLGAHERRLRSEIAQTTATLEQQRRATERLSAAQHRMQQMHRAGGIIAKHGAGGMYLGMRGMRAGVNALAPGLAFDASMSKVQALTGTDKEDAQFKQLRANARALAARTKFNPAEVAEGQRFLAQAGFNPQAILGSMQSMLNIAIAGNIEIEDASNIVSNISSAFAIDPSNIAAMQQLGDQLTTGFSNANVDLIQLGETMKYFAPVAQAAGIDTATSIAMAGMLGNIGIQGSDAGTALRSMTTRLAAPPAEARKALQQLGVSTQDDDGKMRNIVEIMAGVDAAFKERGTESAERLGFLKQIFGQRAMAGASDLTQRMADSMGEGGFSAYLDIIRNSEGNAQRIANIMADNLTGDWLNLKSAFQDVQLSVNDAIGPTLRKLTQSVSALLLRLNVWIEANPKFVKVMGLAAAGFTALLTVVGALTLALGMALMPLAGVQYGLTVLGVKVNPLLGPTGKLGKLFSGLGNTARMLLPALGGISAPMLAVAAAVAAVAFVVWKYWQPIKAFMLGMWDGVAEVMQPVMAGFRDALAPLAPLWDMLASAIATVWGWIKQLFTPFQATSEQLQAATGYGQTFGRILGHVFNVLLLPLRLLASVIGGIATAIVWLADLVMACWQPFAPFLSTLWDSILGGLRAAWDLIVGVLKGAWDIIAGIFTGDGGRILDGISGIWDSIKGYLTTWPAKMLGFGKDMLQGLIDGIKGMGGAVWKALTGVLGSAVDGFKSFLGIRSPSRLFAGLGDNTMQGYAIGIERQQDAPVRAMLDMSQRLRRTAAGIAIGSAGLAAPAMVLSVPAISAPMLAFEMPEISTPALALDVPEISTPALTLSVPAISAPMLAFDMPEMPAPVASTSAPVVSPSARSAAPAPAAAPMTVNITIHAAGGSALDIAREVRRVLADVEHQRHARSRAWQHDYD